MKETLVILLVWNVSIALTAIRDLAEIKSEVVEGKERYLSLLKNSELPIYGECWTSAVQSLQLGCQKLSDKNQSLLALKFTNCMLDMTGQKKVVCVDEDDLRPCLSAMGDRPFSIYQNFFTSTRSMCQFLRIQVWHEETEKTIDRLAVNSDQIATKISESKAIQDTIVEAQKRTFDELKMQTETSKHNIQQMFDELQDRTEQHGALIFEIFDRIGKLQNYVLGEVESFYSVFFYLSAILLSYLTTSVPRTGGARLLLFTVIIFSFLAENMIRKLVVSSSHSALKNVDELQDTVRYWTGTIRYITGCLCLASLVVCAWRFRDYNKLNHRLLMQIQKQNDEVKFFLEALGSSGSSTRRQDVTDAAHIVDAHAYGLEFDERYTESSYDTDSDATYIPDSDGESEDRSYSGYSPPQLTPQSSSPVSNCRDIMPYSRPEVPTSHIERIAEPRYSFRPRNGVNSTSSQPVRESPEEFFAIVQLQEQLAIERRKKLLKKFARGGT